VTQRRVHDPRTDREIRRSGLVLLDQTRRCRIPVGLVPGPSQSGSTPAPMGATQRRWSAKPTRFSAKSPL